MPDNADIPLKEFILLPTTIEIILPYNDFTKSWLGRNPNVRVGKDAGRFVIGYINQDYLETLVREINSSKVNLLPYVMALLGRIDLEASGIIAVQNQPYLNLKGQGVLVGIIDTGIDYTNNAFRYEDGSSKIAYIWDQTAFGNSPDGYNYGTEYTKAQINEALRSDNPMDVVPANDTSGHGTFLASVAASRESGEFIGAAPDAELVVVKLKKARPFFTDYYLVPQKQEDVYLSSDLMLGVQYITDKALELHKPAAICISLGTNLSTHEGLGSLETYLAGMCYVTSIGISVAAGNESDKRHHVKRKVANTGGSDIVEISTGESGGSVYMSMWSSPVDKLSISITSPTGEVVGRVPFKPGLDLETNLVLEKTKVGVNYVFPAEGVGSQLTVIRLIEPSSGTWKITVFGDNIVDGEFHIWTNITGLIEPDIEFLEPDPYYSITVPATALGTISAGAYNVADNSLYRSSSWGPTRLPFSSPLLVAPGVNVAGIYPLYKGTMTGTSVAAAIATGASALMLQWGMVENNLLDMNTFTIRSYLIKGCVRDQNVEYPNYQTGYGRLNLMNTFNGMRNI